MTIWYIPRKEGRKERRNYEKTCIICLKCILVNLTIHFFSLSFLKKVQSHNVERKFFVRIIL